MTKPAIRQCVVIVLSVCLSFSLYSQNLRSFNQNALRSKQTSFAPDDKSLIIRLNGDRTKSISDSVARTASFMPGIIAAYYKGDWGIGMEYGSFNSNPHFDINNYTQNIKSFTTNDISSTQWKSSFLLAGPTYRKSLGLLPITFSTDLLAGVMKMKAPSFSVRDAQQGIVIADYYRESKSSTAIEDPLFAIKPSVRLEWFPSDGFIGMNIHASYLQALGAKQSSTYYRDLSRVKYDGVSQQEVRNQVINAPVLETKTRGPVNNFSFGGGISIKISHDVRSPRDAASGMPTGKRSSRDVASGMATGRREARDAGSGMATGRRLLPTVNKKEIAIDEQGVHIIMESGALEMVSPRDAASGLPTGRRVLPTVNKREIAIDESGVHLTENADGAAQEIVSPRDAASGLPTGRRLLPTVNKREIAIDEPGVQVTCGPVTKKVVNSDGSSEEMQFSCANDAAAYDRAVSTAGLPNKRQTQNTSFGERQNIIHRDLAARNVLSGKIYWSTPESGIVTNKEMVQNGSATSNTQSSSIRQTNQSSFGTLVRIATRDAGSGLATGRRSSRDAASGQATGRREYQPVYSESELDIYNSTLASVSNNPMYKDKGSSGNNPLFQSKSISSSGGIAGIKVLLVDASSVQVVAATETFSSGEFFFANVPEGDYLIKVSGVVSSKKGYDYYSASKTDIIGSIEKGQQEIEMELVTEEIPPVQKATVNTSRSNIKHPSSLTMIEADTDGDGEYESFRAVGNFSDGTSRDITGDAISGTGQRRRVEVLKSNKNGDADETIVSSVSVDNSNNRLRAMATYSDGSTRDLSENIRINASHNGLRQFTISNLDDDDSEGKLVVSRNILKSYFETGDKPTQEQAMRPGNPIGGIIVKGGKNPGGELFTVQTNEDGEFEYNGLEAGQYQFEFGQTIVLDAVSKVTVRGWNPEKKNINTSESNLKDVPAVKTTAASK
jgi:hypothetical protein